uniref:AlNc14C53G4089 protein n=1 Tax=Albugo laibachii Nc14 TaxID=890382 RepID=F0WBP8_9STRA|nr:AlNc14C53G4089 [Albugo laibachii Nc14]CCA20532.1 AlNc14C97G5892 [Albugo laibachii Nc14]|eukprot:CCA20532.1 AlNc14C97G5892 [Albugo laibachii Nc14]
MEPEHSEDKSVAKTSHYGLIAFASVVFDINTGQTLEYLYPSNAPYILYEAKKSLAQLALPHDNTQKEGDSQFVIRFRTDLVDHSEM